MSTSWAGNPTEPGSQIISRPNLFKHLTSSYRYCYLFSNDERSASKLVPILTWTASKMTKTSISNALWYLTYLIRGRYDIVGLLSWELWHWVRESECSSDPPCPFWNLIVATVHAYVHYSIPTALVCGIVISCACYWLWYILKSSKGCWGCQARETNHGKRGIEDEAYIQRELSGTFICNTGRTYYAEGLNLDNLSNTTEIGWQSILERVVTLVYCSVDHILSGPIISAN
jgi:hypothetical protein